MNPTVAVAVFVKTPGLSPIKTRLAQEIGDVRALEIYRACVATTAALLRACRKASSVLSPFWAVAEEEALDHPLWAEFPRVLQQGATLNLRLDSVYRALRSRFSSVILLGADSPLLPPEVLLAAVDTLKRGESTYALSLAHDGGFTLFGGNADVPTALWESVPMSHPSTGGRLREALSVLGPVRTLPTTQDLDVSADLEPLLLSAQSAEGFDVELEAEYQRFKGTLQAIQKI